MNEKNGSAGDPRVSAIGLAVPAHARAQRKMAEFMIRFHGLDARRGRWLRTLYARSRIDTRHSCIPDFGCDPGGYELLARPGEPSSPPGTRARMEIYEREATRLALEACRDAFRPGGPAPESIDHLFVVSCTGFFAPGLDVLLTRELGLRPTVGTTMVGFQGCQGGLSALRLAEVQCRARPESTVLVVCVELCTLHFQLEPTSENLLANSLFADGAAAAIVTGAGAASPGPGLAIRASASRLWPGTLGEMVWHVTDEGFSLRLSSLIARILGAEIDGFLEDAFDAARPYGAQAIWAVHPGGTAILDGIERSLGLPPASLGPSRDVLRRYGNMSSPTIYFVLRECLEDDRIEGGGFALAFGPGLKVEASRIEKVVA